MKFFALLLLVSGIASAQAVKTCTNEKLSCDLWEELPTGGKALINSKTAIFDGYNYDEPSVEPYECLIHLSIEGKNGLVFSVMLGDSDYVASIYNVRTSDYSRSLPTDASFPVVPGKAFYFRNDRQTLQCTLK